MTTKPPLDHLLSPSTASAWPGPPPPWLVELPSCPSTNDWARERLDRLTHGNVIWTQRQSAGRGQAGRSWHSPPGVLTMSAVLVLPPGCAAAAQLSLVAGLALAHAVEDLLPDASVQLKWPNDCYARNRKLAGILCEGRVSPSRHAVVVGIGLNVDPDWQAAGLGPEAFPDLAAMPISLADLGHAPALPTLINQLRDYLLESAALLRDGRWDTLATEWHARDWLLGRSVEVRNGATSQLGQAVGIDDLGRLLLHQAEAGTRAIDGGLVRALA